MISFSSIFLPCSNSIGFDLFCRVLLFLVCRRYKSDLNHYFLKDLGSTKILTMSYAWSHKCIEFKKSISTRFHNNGPCPIEILPRERRDIKLEVLGPCNPLPSHIRRTGVIGTHGLLSTLFKPNLIYDFQDSHTSTLLL